jgi:NAD(P)-dependent dehydrogenase (short-subunit alcohol dehydrogenase family)
MALLALGIGGAAVANRILTHQRLRGLHEKSVLITGGTRGLGLALARCALTHGAHVAICARDTEEVTDAAELLNDEFPDAVLIAATCDVTEPAQVNEFIGLVIDNFGRLDVLINNAGVIQVGPWETMQAGDLAESLDTHVWGPFHTVTAAYPALRAARGRIVNIASIGGKISVPHLLSYNTGKFALVGLSEGLAAELAQVGITVTTVCPGLMRTGSPRNAWFKGRNRAEYAWFSIGDSLPWLSISADEAASRILGGSLARRRHLIFPFHVRLAALAHDVAPGIAIEALAFANRLLPVSRTRRTKRRRGSQSMSVWSPSPLTYLNEHAAATHNQFGGAT